MRSLSDPKRLGWIFGLILGAPGCSAEFVDIEQYVLPCAEDRDCAGDRICWTDRCIPADDLPYPAYAIIIEDASSGAACDDGAPGSDLWAVVGRDETGVSAVGFPHSRVTAEGRGFTFGEGANHFTRVETWNSAIYEQGRSYIDQCPPFEDSRVISLGCGGSAFFTFLRAPWVDGAASAELVPLEPGMSLEIYEFGGACGAANSDSGGSDTGDIYNLRICPRPVFQPSETGQDLSDEDCPVVAAELDGPRSVVLTRGSLPSK